MAAKWMLTATENGATSFSTTGSARVDLFFKTVRGVRADLLIPLIENSWNENEEHTLKILFNTRDCRGGKGERDIFLLGMQWLANTDLEIALKALPLVPEYGRWDDLIKLFVVEKFQEKILEIITERIELDITLAADNKPISLLSKWMPTENGKLDKITHFVSRYCARSGITKKAYRKDKITPLRNFLNLVETKMCNGEWDNIEFQKVPSCAMKKYRKAFTARQPERFAAYLESVQRGEVEIKAKQLFPHELVDEYFKQVLGRGTPDIEPVLEEQWKVLQEQVREMGDFGKSIWMSDMSGSMSGVPMLVAATLALLCCPLSQEPYSNKVMTFATNPVFCTVEGETLRDRVVDMYTKMSPSSMWGGSTNLQAVFDLILNTAVENNLPAELMPTSLYIISDMQFNQAFPGVSNDEAVRIKFEQAGYPCPKIIYWNVRANTMDFPVGNLNSIDTALISGFSPALLKAVLNSTDFTPISILEDTLNDPRYDPISDLFGEEISGE
eukprot:TRINITY_DN10351_c0_g1_i1.p1 TRINITY_DN10351_c0_g1~~TRINITY_DN10351_c0_g1_i1.p1  ORF type:complete len:500 (+),score=119.94 TRINITY_DN10351_c0_g1_i1:56-1555(+)